MELISGFPVTNMSNTLSQTDSHAIALRDGNYFFLRFQYLVGFDDN
jgi:hypothetical protein